MKEYTDLLRSMIRIPSPSFGEAGVCSFLEESLNAMGLNPRRHCNNLVCASASCSQDRPVLALLAHIDTVPPASGYTRDPYDPGTDGGIVYGLGSNDDGGSAVSMIAAFRRFSDSADLPFGLVLVLGCEEERSGANGASLIFDPSESPVFAPKDGSAGDDRLPYPSWAIVGEPTSLQAAVSERGLLVIDGTAHGVSGHAARGEGVNALYIAVDDIQKLRSHRFSRVSPSMGEVRLSVTQIEAGSAHNVVPDSCSFVVDIRPTEQYSNAGILEELQALCKSSLKARNLRNRSSATAQGSPLLAAVRKLGLTTFSSPTTSDWMRLHCDAVKLGPGDSSRSHRADEYITADEIAEGIKTYVELIDTLAHGNIME